MSKSFWTGLACGVFAAGLTGTPVAFAQSQKEPEGRLFMTCEGVYGNSFAPTLWDFGEPDPAFDDIIIDFTAKTVELRNIKAELTTVTDFKLEFAFHGPAQETHGSVNRMTGKLQMHSSFFNTYSRNTTGMSMLYSTCKPVTKR